MNRAIAVVFCAAVAAVLVVTFASTTRFGWSDQGMTALTFESHLSQRVFIWVGRDQNAAFRLSTSDGLPPATSGVYRADIFPGGTCATTAIVIAKDAAGRIVAELPGPVCPNDRWILDAAGFHRMTRQ